MLSKTGMLLLPVVSVASGSSERLTTRLEIPELSPKTEWATADVPQAFPDFSDLRTENGGGIRLTLEVGEPDGVEFETPVPESWPDMDLPSTNSRFGAPASGASMGEDAGSFGAEIYKTTAVPLPSAGLLGFVGLAAVAARRRR